MNTLTKKRKYPVLAVSQGDGNGIGPEIILKTLFSQKSDISETSPGILLFANRLTMEAYSSILNIETEFDHIFETTLSNGTVTTSLPIPGPGTIYLIPVDGDAPVPGQISASAGKTAMIAVEAAVNACLSGHADAVITAPISKEAISKAGYRVPGHTEFLAQCTGSRDVGMILANDEMRIGLATIHLPLSEVSRQLTREHLTKQTHLFHSCLERDFGISKPRLAVLGLNPHAGDGGVLGTEEITTIKPVIDSLKNKGMHITGPFPADGFFGNRQDKQYDLVLAMYHDQGLIPLKLAGFGSGVNVTAGLPIIRTSPDHGTAFSLAGKGQANASSFKAAIQMACSMIDKRNSSSFPHN